MMNCGIGQTIQKLRLAHGISQKTLGEKLGCSQRTISDWENGNTEPNIDAIKKLVALFDVSYEDLLGV